MSRKTYPVTPDGRYFVARARLWRRTDPRLDPARRRALIKALMQARRAVRNATDPERLTAARADVHAAKVALGERGPVWWEDGQADESGRHPRNSSYRDWWAALSAVERVAGES